MVIQATRVIDSVVSDDRARYSPPHRGGVAARINNSKIAHRRGGQTSERILTTPAAPLKEPDYFVDGATTPYSF